MIIERNAKVFKAMGSEVRLLLLEQLSHGEMCACKLQEKIDISQSTLSHHMSILCDCGIVEARKDGKWTFYSISHDRCGEAIAQIKRLDKGSPQNILSS